MKGILLPSHPTTTQERNKDEVENGDDETERERVGKGGTVHMGTILYVFA